MAFFEYTARSFNQIFEAIKGKVKAAVPELTDFSDGNPFMVRLKVWAGIIEQLNYYLDRVAKNSFLSSADLFKNAVSIAYENDYRVKGAKAASVDLLFSFNNPLPSDVNVPLGTILSTEDGIQFVTIDDLLIVTGLQSGTVSAKNAIESGLFIIGTSDGLPTQTFLLNETGVDDFSITVEIDSEPWQAVDTFAYSLPDDKHFLARLNKDGLFVIEFGDGVTGAIPAASIDVYVGYSITDGILGNVSEGKINSLVSLVPLPSGIIMEVSNPLAASGGSNADTLVILKNKIPRQRRTLERAVTKQDYEDIATLYNGVLQAGARETDCKLVDVYIVPNGGGIASKSLRDDVRAYMEDKRTLGVQLNVRAAGETDAVISVFLSVKSNYKKSEVSLAVTNALVAFGSAINQAVGGSLRIGNLYEVIESVAGVSVSDITKFTTRPYAEPLLEANQLNWQRITLDGSDSVVKWQFTVQSAGVFELYKDDSFMGTVSENMLYSYDEIQFKILAGTYSVGDSWVFYTYPYNKSVYLNDFSIMSIKSANITITAE